MRFRYFYTRLHKSFSRKVDQVAELPQTGAT